MSNLLISLRFFGGVAVEREGRPLAGRAAQRRRLGLLTLLAAAPTGQLSRDKILGYLWPESETEAARHLLAGSVYELRKALGDLAILSRGDDLALNPAVVRTDLAEFDAALASGNRERALQLYRGPVADGLFVAHAPEFERWLEDLRSSYARLCREALEQLAQDRERAGLPGAAALWERLALLDPADSRVMLQAMESASRENPAAVVRLAQAHAVYMRRELGAEPDTAVVERAESLRRPAAAATPSSGAEPDPPHSPVGARPSRPGRSAAYLATTGAGLLLIVLAVAGLKLRGGAAAVPSVGLRVLPVEVPGSRPGWSERLTRLLETALSGAAELPGAAASVQVRVEELGPGFRLQGTLQPSRGTAAPPPVNVSGDPDHVAETVDAMALALLAEWPRPPGQRLASVAARTTRSLPALDAWLAGEREYHAGRFLAASEAFARAVGADSGFALAYYRLSQARLAADFPETEVAALDRRALQLSEALPERDRLLIRAWVSFRRGEAESAEQRYQSLTSLYPDDVEAWLQLGETRFHYNPRRGMPLSQAAAPFERALQLDSASWSARWHLAHLAALAGRPGAFGQGVDQLLAMQPEAVQRIDLEVMRALALRDTAAEARLQPALAAADELRLYQLIWRAAVFLHDRDGAARLARVLANPARPTYPRLLGELSLAYLDMAAGRWDSAAVHERAAAALPGVGQTMLESRFGVAVLPGVPLADQRRRELRDALSAQRTPDLHQLLMLGLTRSALGEAGVAGGIAHDLEQRGDSAAALLLRADLAHRAGREAEALRLLVRVPLGGWYGAALGPPLNTYAYARFLRAEVLRGLGRGDEARGWYRSLLECALPDLVYTPAVTAYLAATG